MRVRSAQNGMNIQVGGGSAVIDGGSYMNDETIAIQVNVASSVQNRTDSVVLRMDKNARNTYLYYKPSDTTVVRNDVIFELQLATISVKMNAAQITDSDITDMRSDSTVCGWSTPFDNINVDGIVDQYKGIFERADTDFQAWFQNLKNQLDDNQASNLQNQIDTINGIIVQKDIPEGANLDDYKIEGEFSKKTPTVVIGAPEGITGAFRLSVRTMLGSSGIFQTLYDYVTRSIYYRIGNTTLGFNIPWQKVKTDIDDIPWTTIPGSSNRADYKKVGEIVLIRWSFTSGGNYDISLGTLPEGCRPLNRTYTTAYLTGTTPTINGIQINAATGGNPGLITLFGAKTGNAFSGQYAFSIG
ncbi:phage baseplate protein [Lactococcus petauri]|uniref:phage baseplate protein n=1 Tax=Lactococcus petauri TaxID=1940789 RepID=UPI0022E79221|nr:phage baseplate protein [Lactococcus petauri]MDT2621149.1 phage baseplate protein [Lactococcus petauri]